MSAFRLVAIVEGPSDCRCLGFLLAAWRRHRFATLQAANVKDMVPFRVALGFPHECIEAWVITGHAPSEGERRRESQALGFDPFAHAARLSHKENVPKSAKALKDRLEIGHDQEEAAMTRLVYLVCEGAGADSTGWNAFVRELDAVLAPLLGLPALPRG